jgi:hypothetical protein
MRRQVHEKPAITARKVMMGVPTAKILQKVANLAGKETLPLSIGRVARLEESVQLIGDLDAGLRIKGKVSSPCIGRDAAAWPGQRAPSLVICSVNKLTVPSR